MEVTFLVVAKSGFRCRDLTELQPRCLAPGCPSLGAGPSLLSDFASCSSTYSCCPPHDPRAFAISVPLHLTSVRTCFSSPRHLLGCWSPLPTLPPGTALLGAQSSEGPAPRWAERAACAPGCFPAGLSGVKLHLAILVSY